MPDKSADTKSVILGFFIGLGVGSMLGEALSRWVQHDEAIKAGVARWTVDPKTGATKFEWRAGG